MTSPSTFLTSDAHREAVIADLSTFVDNTVGEQGGVSGTVIKGALSAAKKVDSNIVNKAVARLLPDLAEALDPYWATFKEGGHGDSFEACKSCVDFGFSSVMIDGSALPYEENVALTKKVVDYAHQFDVTVEGELGVLAGVEDDVVAEESHYTRPEEVVDFAKRTGCDSLAISIGTSHGAYKFKPEQCTRDPKTGRLVPPPLAFDVLEAVEKELPGFPIVLHGSSSVPEKYVEMINKYGGALPNAVGIPEEQLRKATKSAVCKINIDSDSRLAFTAGVRETLALHPEYFDPRQYCGKAREYMTELYAEKIKDVLGSDNKLANLD
mgnify:CR=1 FL=1